MIHALLTDGITLNSFALSVTTPYTAGTIRLDDASLMQMGTFYFVNDEQ